MFFAGYILGIFFFNRNYAAGVCGLGFFFCMRHTMQSNHFLTWMHLHFSTLGLVSNQHFEPSWEYRAQRRPGGKKQSRSSETGNTVSSSFLQITISSDIFRTPNASTAFHRCRIKRRRKMCPCRTSTRFAILFPRYSIKWAIFLPPKGQVSFKVQLRFLPGDPLPLHHLSFQCGYQSHFVGNSTIEFLSRTSFSHNLAICIFPPFWSTISSGNPCKTNAYTLNFGKVIESRIFFRKCSSFPCHTTIADFGC